MKGKYWFVYTEIKQNDNLFFSHKFEEIKHSCVSLFYVLLFVSVFTLCLFLMQSAFLLQLFQQ